MARIKFLILRKILEAHVKKGDFQNGYNYPLDNSFKINTNRVNKNSNRPATNQALTNQNKPNNSQNDCNDSDENLLSRDIYVSGVTTLTSIGGQSVATAYDSCRDNFTVEGVKCWKGVNANSYNLQRIPYPCPKGCLNGACKE